MHAAKLQRSKAWEAFTGFLIIAAFAVFIFGAAFVLGTEPHMTFERTGERVFRVTAENYFAGWRFYSRTVEGVTGVSPGNAARNDRSESTRDRNRRQSQRHLKLVGANGSTLRWGRESDQRAVEEFMRGPEPRLALVETPAWWRQALTWFGVGLGALVLVGAVKNAYFHKPSGLP
jgi:hypothetical protein